jgi:hypothetical protein
MKCDGRRMGKYLLPVPMSFRRFEIWRNINGLLCVLCVLCTYGRKYRAKYICTVILQHTGVSFGMTLVHDCSSPLHVSPLYLNCLSFAIEPSMYSRVLCLFTHLTSTCLPSPRYALYLLHSHFSKIDRSIASPRSLELSTESLISYRKAGHHSVSSVRSCILFLLAHSRIRSLCLFIDGRHGSQAAEGLERGLSSAVA